MDVRTLVACETDESDLASLLRLQDCLHPSAFGKYAIWVGLANHFMKLQQVDAISLEPPQRVVDLTSSGGFGASVDLGHQKRFLAVSVAQRVAHTDFTLAAVVVPAVVEKIDALIEARTDDANPFLRIRLVAQMIATEPYERNFFAAATQGSIRNALPGL